ncbi:MAG: cytochrome c oxidase subunit II [Actinomycetota bacterium]
MRPSIASRGRARPSALGALLILLFTSCGGDQPQSALEPAGPFARDADQLWDITFGVAVVIFFVVEAALVWVLFRYRHRPGRKAAQFHGNTRLEIILTVIPAMILATIAVPTVDTIFDLARAPEGAMEIEVIGHRFWWEYRYPEEGITTANEMHIPVDTPIKLRLVGAEADTIDQQEEIIHSFWVPQLGGAQDIIPGREATLLIQADDPGVYRGQCKEYCGLAHGDMRLRVHAETQEGFDSWVADTTDAPSQPTGLAAEGRQIFESGGGGITQPCAGCHAVETDAQGVAPNLANFAARETFAGAIFPNEPEFLRAWIADPQAEKAGAKMPDVGASPQQIDALVAYLRSLD